MARHLRWPRRASAARHRRAGRAGAASAADGARRAIRAELSGGQRQRVGLMRALMLDPGGCCSSTSRSARSTRWSAPSCRTICGASSRTLGKTVVLVTHDLGRGRRSRRRRSCCCATAAIVQRGHAAPSWCARRPSRSSPQFVEAQRRLPPRGRLDGDDARVRAALAAARGVPRSAAARAPRRRSRSRVGSKTFTESVILGEIAAAAGARGGRRASRTAQLGGTRVVLGRARRRRASTSIPSTPARCAEEILRGDAAGRRSRRAARALAAPRHRR